MSGVSEFFAMGGHGPYVWSAWALVVIGLAGAVWRTLSERKAARDTAKGLGLSIEPAPRAGTSGEDAR